MLESACNTPIIFYNNLPKNTEDMTSAAAAALVVSATVSL